jgi:hypothetical protein
VAKIATLPGVVAPSTTLVLLAAGALERNFRLASSGSQASRSTPRAASITARAGRVRLTALATCTTTGMPAKDPCKSVEASSFSLSFTPPFLNLMAFARSMVCGKSRFHSCGGTYGHLVM